MGKINGCLKCLFIFFNVLYAILGCGLIYMVVKGTAYSTQLSSVGSPGIAWGWVFAIGVFAISCLGIFAGCAENGIALKIFAGFMVVGMVIMLIFGIVLVVMRDKVKEKLENPNSEAAKPFMEVQETRAMLEEIQKTVMCCGVVSYKDWDDHIPDSCECKTTNGRGYREYAGPVAECKSKPQGVRGPDQIYSQTCGGVIFQFVNLFFKIMMGFCFGMAVKALLGLLISILMILQVRRHDSGGGASIAMKGY
ncbi:CD63 antigen-like [Anoplopoma fimbria]|uniref:CD63 antigen-like n=1 Tax=Anoplopoma fimbria TaxID=229290 RepID=UPI0023ECD0F8|nr:CD63 antigen-like [Anoplopoma fimbria]